MAERHDHIMFARYLDENGYVFVHPPLEGKRSPVTGRILKAMGMKKGVPDFLIFGKTDGERYYRFSGVYGVAIEMKSDSGRPSKEQAEWLKTLGMLGWRVCVAYGYDDAVLFMTNHVVPTLVEWAVLHQQTPFGTPSESHPSASDSPSQRTKRRSRQAAGDKQ